MTLLAGRTDERRWDLVWELLPYPLLLVGAVVAALDGDLPAGRRWVAPALVVVTAGWHAWMITAHPGWPGRLAPMLAYYAVLLGLVAALASLHLVFLLVYFACAGMAFVALPGWWAYAAAPVTGLAFIATNRTSDPLFQVGVFTAFTGAAILFGAMFRLLEGQLRALRAANVRLAELSGQNAALQAELLGRAREAGVLDERARLAREIHDTIGQGLAAIVTQVEAASGTDEASHRRLGLIGALARDSLTEARRSVRALRPSPLASTHLPAAVTDTAERWSAATGVPVELTVTGTAHRLHTEVEVALLRVVQEALSNVDKHAAAGRVGVTLSYLDDEVLVDVRDDGAGFVAGGGDGFGLTAMRQRVTRLAGRLDVESAPGAGTAISVGVPVIPPGEPG